jgi:hypothetical protein
VSGWLSRLHDHWFAPAPLRDLAAVRIVLVGMQVTLLLWPFLARKLGACAGCNPRYQLALTAIDAREFTPLPALKVLLLPLGWGARPGAELLDTVWVVTAVAGMFALLGVLTRPSLLILAAGSTLLVAHAYSYRERHHPEAMLTIMLWTLAFAPSGARWSVDALLRRRRGGSAAPDLSLHARWPLRLGQWLFVLMYLSAGTSKLLNGGIRWMNGYTLAAYIADNALERGAGLGVWVAQQLPLVQLLSIGAIVFELGFVAVMLWPRLTWVFVLGGVALHGAIFLLQRAPFPQLIALYIVFIGELRRWRPALLLPPSPLWIIRRHPAADTPGPPG